MHNNKRFRLVSGYILSPSTLANIEDVIDSIHEQDPIRYPKFNEEYLANVVQVTESLCYKEGENVIELHDMLEGFTLSPFTGLRFIIKGGFQEYSWILNSYLFKCKPEEMATLYCAAIDLRLSMRHHSTAATMIKEC